MSKSNGSKNGTGKSVATSNDEAKLNSPASIETTGTAPVHQQDLHGKPQEVVQGFDAEGQDHDTEKISGSTSMVAAGRSYVAHQLKKLREAEPTAREGKDREGVHDMRVASRRLRECLRLLGETAFDRGETDVLRNKLKPLTRTLGEARDTDVFLEHLDTYDAELPVKERSGLAPLRKELKKRYKRSHKALHKLLDDPKVQKLYDQLEKFATNDKIIADASGLDSAAVAPSLVRHFAGSAIWRRYEGVLAYDTVVDAQTSQETLHRLRMAFKQLRYTIEFFEDALPPSIKSMHDQLVQTQDDLGAIHDDYAANLYLAQTVLDTKKPDAALVKYQESREADSKKMREDFLQRWKQLSGPKFKKQLATEIANIAAH